MNIGSSSGYPSSSLSNFAGHRFEIDGIQCNSMEGLLQAFKYEKIDSQIATCQLIGFSAKKKGSGRNSYWQEKQTLWWNGVAYPRKSKDYQFLLNRAYNALYLQNESFRKCLEDAGNAIFTHSIGRNNEKETVLTEREFCSRLQHLKDIGLLQKKNQNYGKKEINEKITTINAYCFIA